MVVSHLTAELVVMSFLRRIVWTANRCKTLDSE